MAIKTRRENALAGTSGVFEQQTASRQEKADRTAAMDTDAKALQKVYWDNNDDMDKFNDRGLALRI